MNASTGRPISIGAVMVGIIGGTFSVGTVVDMTEGQETENVNLKNVAAVDSKDDNGQLEVINRADGQQTFTQQRDNVATASELYHADDVVAALRELDGIPTDLNLPPALSKLRKNAQLQS